MMSAWPMAITTSRLIPLTLPARSSSFDLPSGLIDALSKSKSTSVAKVTFSATGLGAAACGAGFGVDAAGAGAGVGAGAGAGAGASWVAQPTANPSAASQSQVVLFTMFPPTLSESLFGSSVCMILEGILPHPPTSVQAGERFGQQGALADQALAAYPDVAHVLPPGGIHEVRYRVVAGRELGSAKVQRDEVGCLARLDRADRRAQAQGKRAAERRGAQRRMRRQ